MRVHLPTDRQAAGSSNQNPHEGKTNTPHDRSLKGRHLQRANAKQVQLIWENKNAHDLFGYKKAPRKTRVLSISIRYGGKLSYAMQALSPMLGSNSCQAETALSQVLGHDGASRHTLLGKMLRHNSTRVQSHSDTSIGLRQRSCAAVYDMFL